MYTEVKTRTMNPHVCPSPNFNSHQLMANLVSTISIHSTTPTAPILPPPPLTLLDYFEANPRWNIISIINCSVQISKIEDSL